MNKPTTTGSDEEKRTIVLIYGMFDTGKPFWVFAAVKASQYSLFQSAYQEKKVDLYHFAPYGEIIISGEGKAPPDEITLKVAEMYQTDPNTLIKSTKNE